MYNANLIEKKIKLAELFLTPKRGRRKDKVINEGERETTIDLKL